MATYPRKTCSYLAADGPYRELCAELVGKYPNLQHEDYRHAALAPRGLGRRRSFRFVCIDLTTKTAQISSIATSVSDVKRCIQLHAQVVNARCLYILEGQTRTLTALIGDQLRVDPRVFLRQQKTGMYEAEQDGGNTPSLASTLQEVDHGYTFNIHEPRYFPDPPAGFHDANHYSADTGRYIRRPGQDGEFKKMGIITSNASFWSRPRAHEGWQG